MLSVTLDSGVNAQTSSSKVSVLELTGTINGHTASFKPGLHASLITIPETEPTPVVVKTVTVTEPAKWPKKMPNRRGGFNQVLKMSDGMKLYLRTGEFADGSLGEIFVDTQKEGTFARSMLNCFAVAISTGLQWGVPLSVYVEQFKNVMFEPKGSVSGSDTVEEATSIIDAIFKELEAAYPNGKAPVPAHVRSVVKLKN